MKKLLWALLGAALLLCLTWGALASGCMKVTNCQEWVSLRAKPSTSAKRLAKVPLGALVSDCETASGGFIACSWGGQPGYILSKYLETEPRDLVSENPTVEEVWGVGRTLLDYTGDRWRVIAQRVNMPDCEAMIAVVFDLQGRYVSRLATANWDGGELPALDAWIGGPAEEKYLLWFDTGVLSGFGIGPEMGDDQLWAMPLSGAGISHAVDTDGTTYLIGYYTDRLARVSPEGELVWENHGSGRQDIWWPSRIELREDQALVTYAGGNSGEETLVAYSKADGSPLGARPAAPVLVQWAEDAPAGSRLRADLSQDPEEAARMVFTAVEPVTDFRVLSISFTDYVNGVELYESEPLYKLASLKPSQPLEAAVTLMGDMPELAISCVGADGAIWCCGLALSGEDGSLITFPLQVNPESGYLEYR